MPEFTDTWSPHPSVTRALDVALAAANGALRSELQQRPTPVPRTRRVAIGDPQAPIERFFRVLVQNDLLDPSGWLASDVHLVSMGDHFDFGPFEQRREAGLSGERLLSWLAAHPADQVTLLAGNHDVSRVGELTAFSAEEFERAALDAQRLYRQAHPDTELEREFFERYPALPSVEVAARDLSTFRPEQRTLVQRLLQEKRMRLAAEYDGVLLCHAGVTRDHLEAIGVTGDAQSDATQVSAALNHSLDSALQTWSTQPDQPLFIPQLHRAGSARTGEAGGILVHRPACPANDAPSSSPELFARRYDPRRLPRGLIQVTGHVRDPKSRKLLGPWTQDAPGPEGALRTLTLRGEHVEYRRGVPAREPGLTAMVFTDGAMGSTPPEQYQVLDLNTLSPLEVSAQRSAH